MRKTIEGVKLFESYSLVKYTGVKRWEAFPEWGLIADPDVLDFVEFCQEKGKVLNEGQYTYYRRI